MVDEDETVEQVYAEAMETTGVFPSRQTYAKRYLAAHKRELAAKDTEIARLKSTIKELADTLYEEVSWVDDAVGIAFPVKQNNEAKIRELVTKARKVIGDEERQLK